MERRLAECNVTICRIEPNLHLAEDAEATSLVASQHHAEWVLLDGYGFDEDYLLTFRRNGQRTALIDDSFAPVATHADLILNHNAYADERDYRESSFCNPVLAGSRYTLLRREFKGVHRRVRASEGASPNVLVTMGGSDPRNATSSVLRLLEQLEFSIRITVVIGASNPRAESLIREFQTVSYRHQVAFLVDPPHIVELFCKADLAVAAAGVTASELAALGTPMALVIAAANQAPVAAFFERQGAALLLGDDHCLLENHAASKLSALLMDRDLRRGLSQRGLGLIDCRGADRVVEHLLNFPITLRGAQEGDAELIFQWANDSQSRSMSHSSEPIPWEKHVAWFRQKIGSSECRFLVALNETGFPVGVVRLDRKDDDATLSFSVAAEERGLGYGHRMVRLVSTLALLDGWCKVIHASVKPHNVASLRVLRKSGFTEMPLAGEKQGAACQLIFGEHVVPTSFLSTNSRTCESFL
jgi:spore coat polysaccharide biosynthesis predicted glycosyltransferase SpsG/RimJ/RimL family protein N-acetyltransferase